MNKKFDVENTSMLLCGIATGVSLLSFGLAPYGSWLWLIAEIQKSTQEIGRALFILITCGLLAMGGLPASIFAKIINPKSKWPVVNSIVITILFITNLLLVMGVGWISGVSER